MSLCTLGGIRFFSFAFATHPVVAITIVQAKQVSQHIRDLRRLAV